MKYNYLGNSGLRVSEMCLGTMTWGYSTDKTEAKKIYNTALESGINFIDTADSYTNGASESMVGDIIAAKRKDIVIGTKFTNPMGDGPNDAGSSRIHIMKAVEDSLKNLRTDYIDLYYIHHTDYRTPMEETLRALDDLVRQGKILYAGCSNYEAWRLCDAHWVTEFNKLSPLICYQGNYSLVVRDLEADVLPVCDDKGIGFVAYGALAHGFLSGQYKPGDRKVEGSRSASNWVFLDNLFIENSDEVLQTLLDIAETNKISPADVALKWVNSKASVNSVLVGPRTDEQMKKSLECCQIFLNVPDMDSLNIVSKPRSRYPLAMELKLSASREERLK